MSNNDNGIMSFTGPAGRTYYGRDGVLQTAGENEIREEYDPLTGAYRGILIESQDRTNYTPNSKDLGGIPGSEDGSTKTAPDGSEVKGYKIAGNNFFKRFEGWDNSDDSLTTSVWVCANKPVTLEIRKPLNSDREEVDCHITTEWQRFSATSFRENGYSGGENKTILDGRHISDDSIVVYAFGFQVESGPVATSYIETNGSPVTMPGEDARFTDPTVFNNFERGAFHVDFRSTFAQSDSFILYRGSSARFLYYNSNNLRSYDGSNTVQQMMPDSSLKKPHKYQVSWGEGGIKTNVDGSAQETRSFDGDWGDGDLVIGYRWSGYIKSLDFNPEPYSDAQARQITKRDARTIIGECPNGGYYDYSDLRTMLTESDESGILPEDRKVARVGDPIGAILDKSGHGNHLTASTDSRRGVLRFDGENYYIERDNYTVYGFDYVGDRSLTAIIALQNYSDNFIVLCNSDAGGGDYAMIYGPGTGSYLNWGSFSDPRHYFNGKYRPTSNRGDAHAGLTTDPIILRTLHQVQNEESTRIFVGGYTVSSWDLTGNEYGFAWGSRLSEDDAAFVEQEMRQSMPSVSD